MKQFQMVQSSNQSSYKSLQSELDSLASYQQNSDVSEQSSNYGENAQTSKQIQGTMAAWMGPD